MLLKRHDPFGQYIIIDIYDPIYVDDYVVETCNLGEDIGSFYKISGKGFVIRHKGKEVFRSNLCMGSRFKEYIYEMVYECQKRDLNATLGI